MKTIYIPKENPDGYIEYPPPEHVACYYVVTVPDNFTLSGKVFNTELHQFISASDNDVLD